MGVRLQRQLTSRDSLSAGQYFVARTEHMSGHTSDVYIACPKCAGRALLREPHIVERQSGKVLPAWRCIRPQCGFHDWLQLQPGGDE